MATGCDLVDIAHDAFLRGAQDLEQFTKAVKKAVGQDVPPDVLKAAFEKAADRYEANSKELADIKRELGQTVNQARTSTWQEKIASAFKAGLISSARLLGRNVLSHFSLAAAEEVSRIPAAVIDSAMALRTGQRTVLPPDIASIGRTMNPTGARAREAARQIGELVRTGHISNDPFDKDGPLAGLGITKETVYKTPALNAAINGVFRLHGATDRPFRLYAFSRSIDEQATLRARWDASEAKKAGVPAVDVQARAAQYRANPTDAMVIQAVSEGQAAVFANKNILSTQAANLRRNMYAHSQMAGLATDVAMPFTKVPVNVVLRSLEYQGGAVPAAVEAAFRKNITPEQQSRIAKMFGRGVTGAGLTALGYLLADKGLMTGADMGQKDANRRKAAKGQQASFFAGGRYYALKAASPVTAPLLLGATLREQAGRAPAYMAAIKAGAEEAANLPFTSLGSNVKDVLENPQQKGARFVGNLASGAVPALVGDVAAQLDASKGGPKRIPKTIPQYVEMKVPGLRETVPANPKDKRPQPSFPLVDPTLSTPGKAPRPRIAPADLARILSGKQ